MNIDDPTATRVQPQRRDGHPLRGALGLALVALLGFGLVYSLLGAGLGGLLFPQAASGSLVERDGRIVGSLLVAQPFAGKGYFQPRPSAAGYDPMNLAGSNQSRTNPGLRAYIDAATVDVVAREGISRASVPDELVTRSGSAIDPHLSPEGAAIQVRRVAHARGLTPQAVEAMVRVHTEPPQLGVFGRHRINVLALNLALDAAAPMAQGGSDTPGTQH